MATKKDFAGMMRRDTPTFNIDLGTFDITGYTFRLTIKKLGDIFLKNLLIEMFLVGFKK